MSTIEETEPELDFQVPPQTAVIVNSLAEKMHVTRAEIFSMGLALLQLAVAADEKGQRLLVTDLEGKPVTEITLFPKSGT